MTTRDELEAEARSKPYGDAMDVYADLLQAEGDPRGELIALDTRDSHDVKARRGELTRAWLGDVADVCWDPLSETWNGLRDGVRLDVRRGFLRARCEGPDAALSLQAILERPIGACITDIVLHGRDRLLHALVDVLRSAPRRALRSLTISRYRSDDQILIDDDVHADLVAATPNLEALTLRGDMLVACVLHPALATLRTEVWAVDPAFGHRPISCASLALELTHGAYPLQVRGAFESMATSSFPRLTALELGISGDELVFPWLADLGVASQLVELQLPALRTLRDDADAQRALDRMPRLQRVSFASGCAWDGDRGRTLHHPRAEVLIGTPAPWPLPGRCPPLIIDGVIVPVDRIDRMLWNCYDRLPEAAREGWDRLFAAMRALPDPVGIARSGRLTKFMSRYRTQRVGVDCVLMALEATHPDEEWGRLRDHLRTSARDREIRVRWAID